MTQTPILPGATIGFLGGGQLGRMAAMAARSMGYDIQVLDPDTSCSARPIASKCITAQWGDTAAGAALARECAVVTLEIEQIPVETLDAVAAITPLHPGSGPLYIVQDRARQKEWLRSEGFPLGGFKTVTTEQECVNAVRALGPSIVKSSHGGYDGRGQARVTESFEGANAFTGVGGGCAVVEAFLDIHEELSVMVARSADGAVAVYPPSRNHHTAGVLTWAVTPGGFASETETQAMALALQITERLGIVGLLAVEMFKLTNGDLLVNELAPRPHNTYHHSERAHATSQFEQMIRAVCGLPLGATDILVPGAIHNLLGDLWHDGIAPDFAQALTIPGVRVHLYGKPSARPGRKMGHLSSVGATPEAALARVQQAYELLTR